jgi:hypothetical protein
MNPPNYEFNDSENRVFADIAAKMRAVGFIGIFFGSLNVVLNIFYLSQTKESRAISQALAGIIQGGFLVLIGTWTRNAGSSFRQIVDSRGKDINNLMDAMGSLRKLYTLQYWLLIVALLLIVLGFIAASFAGLRG